MATMQAAELAGELRTVINRLAYHLRLPAAQHGITPSRLSVLVALDKGGRQRPGSLAGRLGISAASMSRLAEVMEADDLVERRPDPEDGRAWLLQIASRGSGVLAALREEGTGRLSEDLAALPAEQLRALEQALPVLVTLADRHLELDVPTVRVSHTSQAVGPPSRSPR